MEHPADMSRMPCGIGREAERYQLLDGASVVGDGHVRQSRLQVRGGEASEGTVEERGPLDLVSRAPERGAELCGQDLGPATSEGQGASGNEEAHVVFCSSGAVRDGIMPSRLEKTGK